MLKQIGKILAAVYIAVALAPLVAVSGIFVWQLISPSPWQAPWDNAVKSTERAQELAAKGLYEQQISFGEGVVGLREDAATKLFDLYAIGISQTTMAPQITPVALFSNRPSLPLPSLEKKFEYASPNPVVGAFNNIVIFDAKSGQVAKLFDVRLAISNFSLAAKPNFESLIIFATDKDSDKDGELSGIDTQDIYIYALNDRTLRRVSGVMANPSDVVVADGADYVLVRATQDTNRDGGTRDSHPSGAPAPTLLYRVDLRTAVATPLLPKPMLDDLQRTLNAGTPAPTAK